MPRPAASRLIGRHTTTHSAGRAAATGPLDGGSQPVHAVCNWTMADRRFPAEPSLSNRGWAHLIETGPRTTFDSRRIVLVMDNLNTHPVLAIRGIRAC